MAAIKSTALLGRDINLRDALKGTLEPPAGRRLRFFGRVRSRQRTVCDMDLLLACVTQEMFARDLDPDALGADGQRMRDSFVEDATEIVIGQDLTEREAAALVVGRRLTFGEMDA